MANEVSVADLCKQFERDLSLQMHHFVREFTHSEAQKILCASGKDAFTGILEHLQNRQASTLGTSTEERLLRGWCFLLDAIREKEKLSEPSHKFTDFPRWVLWLETQCR